MNTGEQEDRKTKAVCLVCALRTTAFGRPRQRKGTGLGGMTISSTTQQTGTSHNPNRRTPGRHQWRLPCLLPRVTDHRYVKTFIGTLNDGAGNRERAPLHYSEGGADGVEGARTDRGQGQPHGGGSPEGQYSGWGGEGNLSVAQRNITTTGRPSRVGG